MGQYLSKVNNNFNSLKNKTKFYYIIKILIVFNEFHNPIVNHSSLITFICENHNNGEKKLEFPFWYL